MKFHVKNHMKISTETCEKHLNSQTRGLGTRLMCLLTWSGSGTSGEPTARGDCGVSAWCSRSVHIVHVVADQEHSDCTVPQYRYRTELVWRVVMPTAHVRTVG